MLGVQIAKAGSKEKKRDPGFQWETFWRYSVGAAGHTERLWIDLMVAGFHLGFMCTLIWEGNSNSCKELWLSS